MSIHNKFVTLTNEERKRACEWYNDPDGANIEETYVNMRLRHDMQRATSALRAALTHPKDDDAAAFLKAIREAVK